MIWEKYFCKISTLLLLASAISCHLSGSIDANLMNSLIETGRNEEKLLVFYLISGQQAWKVWQVVCKFSSMRLIWRRAKSTGSSNLAQCCCLLFMSPAERSCVNFQQKPNKSRICLFSSYFDTQITVSIYMSLCPCICGSIGTS